MQLPSLVKGKRFITKKTHGSSDALYIAQLALREKARGQRIALVTEFALDAQRLLEEIVFFAPDVHCVLFPDWETLPYDTFSIQYIR